MWDEYGFNGDVNNDDPGILNLRRGVASLSTKVTDSALASIQVDTEFGDLAGAIAKNNYRNLTGLATPSTIDGPPFENILEQFASYAPLWTLCCNSGSV